MELQFPRLLLDKAEFNTDEFQCCQALFFKWRGSALAQSINLPTRGGNSCLDFCCEMKEVIFSRFVAGFRFVLFTSAFFFSTSVAFVILSQYLPFVLML